jgi:hypothetical protein
MTRELIDENRLIEISARVEATSNGPWTAMIEGRDHSSGSSCMVTKDGAIDLSGATDADIEFMARSRQDIPYLISELYRLENMLNKN